jgi:hypothetical protein
MQHSLALMSLDIIYLKSRAYNSTNKLTATATAGLYPLAKSLQSPSYHTVCQIELLKLSKLSHL